MKTFQVVGIGNAMVDVIAHADEAFLAEAGVQKGIMQLIDMPRAIDLYSRIGPSQEISGGSAANTIAGVAHLGGRTAYVGKVKDDQLGAIGDRLDAVLTREHTRMHTHSRKRKDEPLWASCMCIHAAAASCVVRSKSSTHSSTRTCTRHTRTRIQEQGEQ